MCFIDDDEGVIALTAAKSVSSPDSREAGWDAVSFRYFWELARNGAEVAAAGVHVQSKLASGVELFEMLVICERCVCVCRGYAVE